jgi:hypothetical protein
MELVDLAIIDSRSASNADGSATLSFVIPRACDFIKFQTLGQCPLSHKSPGAPSFAFFGEGWDPQNPRG